MPEPEDGAADLEAEQLLGSWGSVVRVGAWAAVASSVALVKCVPEVWKPAWGEGFAFVLAQVEAACTELELRVALLWLLFLPQAVLWMPGRGGPRSRHTLDRRFRWLQQREWGLLVVEWQRRVVEVEEMPPPSAGDAALAKQVSALIAGGHVSKAAQRLQSFGARSLRGIQQWLQRWPASFRQGTAIGTRQGWCQGVLLTSWVGSQPSGWSAFASRLRLAAVGCAMSTSQHLGLAGSRGRSSCFRSLGCVTSVVSCRRGSTGCGCLWRV